MGSAHTTTVLYIASRRCSKQHAAFLCSFHQSFPPCILLKFKWCNHTVVLTWLELGRIPILFLSKGLHSHIVINLSIAVHALPMCMLILLSVDEILLPRYKNWSTNFKHFIIPRLPLSFYKKRSFY